VTADDRPPYRTRAALRPVPRPASVTIEPVAADREHAVFVLRVSPLDGWWLALAVSVFVVSGLVCWLLLWTELAPLALLGILLVFAWGRFAWRIREQRLRFVARARSHVRVIVQGPAWLDLWRVVGRGADGRELTLLAWLSSSQARYVEYALAEAPELAALPELPELPEPEPRVTARVLLPPSAGGRFRVACPECDLEFNYGRSACPHCEVEYTYADGVPVLAQENDVTWRGASPYRSSR
jgi:hypothetical protein